MKSFLDTACARSVQTEHSSVNARLKVALPDKYGACRVALQAHLRVELCVNLKPDTTI